MGEVVGKVYEGQIRARTKGFVEVWIIKVVAGIVLLAAIAWGIHVYNESLRDEGRAEVKQAWTEATAAQTEAFEAERKRLEQEKGVISRQYYAEKTTREDVQRRVDKEREDAIRGSAVAGNQCFDDRMQDNWNRDSGYPASGSARRGVDAAVSRPSK